MVAQPIQVFSVLPGSSNHGDTNCGYPGLNLSLGNIINQTITAFSGIVTPKINESVWIPLIFISSVALIFGVPNAAPAACLVLAIVWVHGSLFAQWQ